MRPIAVLAAVALLAACSQQKAEPAESTEVPAAPAAPAVEVSGFTHPAGADLFGYYMPKSEVKVGNWKLDNFHIGDEMGFAEWEAGTRSPTYGPVMFEFDDVSSPKTTNELGGEVHTVRERVVADAYEIAEDGTVKLVDQHPKLGRVTFTGKLDRAKLAGFKRENLGTDEAVLTGTLTVGDQTFRDLGFSWFGGD